MAEKAFSGDTVPRVDDLGDGTHIPVVKTSGGGGGGGAGTSDTTEATQLLVKAGVDAINADLGAPADAAAASDTGTFSITALIKRGLQNWTTLLARVPAVALSGRMRTEDLGQVGVARQLAAGAASANTELTSTCCRVSIHARGGNIRFAIGSSGQTASGSSHYIAQGERLDLAVPATPNIAVIRADSTDCTLELTELTEPV